MLQTKAAGTRSWIVVGHATSAETKGTREIQDVLGDGEE